jgi:hypothetical protein
MAGVNPDDERIRLALAAGDPASQDAGLSPQEQRAMLAHLRVSVSRPVSSFGRNRWMRPLLAGGTTIALALLLWIWSWPRHESPMAAANGPGRPQALEGVTAPPPSIAAVVAPTAPSEPGPAQTTHVQATPASVATSTGRLIQATVPAATAVRMIAKGGTKIVWVVNSNATF